MKLYLAGKVPKGDEVGRVPDWRAEYARALTQLDGVGVLSPEDPNLDESQPMQVFGHDCYLVRESDGIIVNASSRLGVGTAQEMVLGKYYRKLVLTVLPPDSHHRCSNVMTTSGPVREWLHPFVLAMSDVICDDLVEAVAWLREHLRLPDRFAVKGFELIEEAIEAYLSTCRESDRGGACR